MSEKENCATLPRVVSALRRIYPRRRIDSPPITKGSPSTTRTSPASTTTGSKRAASTYNRAMPTFLTPEALSAHTLASAIAADLAQGREVADAVQQAHHYVLRAIATAPGWGAGHGPLNHAHTVRR